MPRLRSISTRVVVNVDDDYAAQLLRSGGYQPLEKVAEPQPTQSDSDDELECVVCGRDFRNKAGLHSHMKTHEEA